MRSVPSPQRGTFQQLRRPPTLTVPAPIRGGVRRRFHHAVPYQVVLAAQDLIGLLLGDEPFDLAEAAPVIAAWREFTTDGLPVDRFVWSKVTVLARAAELVAM